MPELPDKNTSNDNPPSQAPPDMMTGIVDLIERLSEWSGRLVSWLVLIMVMIIVYDVSMRYMFKIGSVALQELEWHMFAVLFLLGAAYTFKHNGHVCVDVFYNSSRFSDRTRAWINVLGFVLFLLPFSVLVIYTSSGFVANAYMIGEGSPDPGGLPYRFLLKAMIPAGFVLLVMQGVAHFLRNLLIVLNKSQPGTNEV